MAVFVVLSLIKGGRSTKSIINMPYCKWDYWLINIAIVIACVTLAFFLEKNIENKFKEKKMLGIQE